MDATATLADQIVRLERTVSVLACYATPQTEREIRDAMEAAVRYGWSRAEHEYALAAIQAAREARAQAELDLTPAAPVQVAA